jgi:hypothetical protein
MQLLCLGDIALRDDVVSSQMWPPPAGIIPSSASKILFNWELPIGTEINPRPRSSGPRLLSHPFAPNVLRRWSPGFASLATNHILDAGEEGLSRTAQALNNLGFTTLGAGEHPNEIAEPLYWATSEGRLAVINWVFPETHPDWHHVPGPNCWPGSSEAERIIKESKRVADWVLVLVHWSDELFAYPRPDDRKIAHELASIGADLVIGHHPHVIRGMEVIGSCTVFYSLGNFYFSNYPDNEGSWIVRQSPRNREGLGVHISFKRGSRPKCRMLSFWQLKNRVVTDPLHRAAKRAKRVSKPLIIRGLEYASWYERKRAAFFLRSYFWEFGVWRLGKKDIIRILLKRFFRLLPGLSSLQ